MTMRNKTKEEQFREIFYELTGIKVEDAKRGPDDYLFIPLEADLSKKDEIKREIMTELAEYKWRHHLVDGKIAGWWIKLPPSML